MRELLSPLRAHPGPVLFVVVVVGYLLGGYFASELHEIADLGGVFFIPAGLTAAAIILNDVDRWPIIVAAAFTAELVTDLQLYGFGLGSSLGFAAANSLEPLVGGIIVRRWRGRIDISCREDLAAFFVGAVGAGPLVGSVIGAFTVGVPGRFFNVQLSWWLGDGLAVLIVGGLILTFTSSRDRWPDRALETFLALSSIAVLAIGLHWITTLPVGFLAAVPVVTVAARSGTRVGMTAAAIVAAIGMAGWFPSSGQIGDLSEATVMIVLQLELVSITVAALLVAAESSEREALSVTYAYQTETMRRLREALAPESVIRTEHVVAEGISRAASERLAVGGDWYDIFESDDGEVSIIIGDVVGHSEEAVIGMGKLRPAAAALALRASDTGVALDWIDEFARNIEDRPYATAFFARFNPHDRSLMYSAAGHPPALLGRSDGTWEWLEGGRSTPIGVPFPTERPSEETDLDALSTLIVYTDGAVERSGEMIDTGLARVLDAVTAQPTASVDELLAELTSDSLRDDASFVRIQLRC